MSLPTSEPVPNDTPQSPPVRRRRGRRLIIPSEVNERATFLDKLARRTLPSFDFFLFSLLAGAILAGGILLDSPTLFFLGALTAPFMAPLVGLSLSSVIGSGWFFLQTLFGILIGSLLVFITGVLAGLASYLLPDLPLKQAIAHAQITWIDFLVLTLGVLLLTITLVRTEQKPLMPSVILAYELYLPVGVAGFGLSISLTGGTSNLWPSALVTFIFYLTWVVFLGIIALWVIGIRPLNLFGYAFGALIVIISLVVGFEISGISDVLGIGGSSTQTTVMSTNTNALIPTATTTNTIAATTATPDPTTTFTPTVTRTPTHTLVPSATPTETLTPAPTPLWAIVRADNGAYVRAEPNFNAKIVDGVLDGGLVQVLPDTVQDGGTTWVHIITNHGIEGWIVQSILVTATPVPTW
jgi:uncharacterized membrane protein